MFNGNEGYSLADVAAATGANNDGWGGNGGAWWIIILFLFCFMGWGGNGINGAGRQAATTDDVQNQFNFASLERQNNEIVANSRQVAYDLTGDIKDMGLATNNIVRDVGSALNENVRDIQALVQQVGYEQAQGYCGINKNIDSVRYDAAINTRDIMKNDCDNTQKILDAISGNRIADMQNQINQLQLQNAVAGVVRYPSATTYSAGLAPMYGACPAMQ